jgi:hypothetical protein
VKSQDSYRAMQVIRLQGTSWLLIGGLTLGLGTWGCLGRSSRGACFRKSAYKRRQRKAGMGRYLCMGPFILALDSFYGLTSNFLCSITCFEGIFCSFPHFDAFPTCGQASTLGSWDSLRFLLSQGSVLGHQEL